MKFEPNWKTLRRQMTRNTANRSTGISRKCIETCGPSDRNLRTSQQNSFKTKTKLSFWRIGLSSPIKECKCISAN